MTYEFVYPEGKSLVDFTTVYDAVTETYRDGDFQPDAVRSAAKEERAVARWLASLKPYDRALFCPHGTYWGFGGVFVGRRCAQCREAL